MPLQRGFLHFNSANVMIGKYYTVEMKPAALPSEIETCFTLFDLFIVADHETEEYDI